MELPQSVPEASIILRLHKLVEETDYEFVTELIDVFLDEAPRLISSIEASLHSADFQQLALMAHSLKGSCKNFGANSLGDLCLRFEEIGRSGNMPSILPDLDELKLEYSQVVITLQHFKQQKGTA